MTKVRWPAAGWLGVALGLGLASCGPEPVSVVTGLEIVIAEGDGQFGPVGEELSSPLRAVVRVAATQAPREGTGVEWSVVQGDATIVGPTTTTTDETGSVEVALRLGAVPGEVRVRATIVEQTGAFATFTEYAVWPPELDAVSPGAAAPGDVVTVTGANFSPVPEQNVVRFSGIRGRVMAASGMQLQVEVPRCLPQRDVNVSVQLGVIVSDSATLTVTAPGEVTSLALGGVIDIADDAGYECYRLDGTGGAEYLVIVQSASNVGAARHPYELSALSTAAAATTAAATTAVARATRRPGLLEDGGAGRSQALWEEHLRALEGELVARSRGATRVGPLGAPAAPPAGVPSVGESRVFSVLKRDNTFEQVTAIAQYVGTQAAIFVDQDAPGGGFTNADLQAFAARFDEVIHPEVTGAFGTESDLDGNDRVIILFTPAVNRLTPSGSSGFIGGYFFGNDLIPSNQGSNAGEVFYSLVPDPTGIHSDVRTKSTVLSVVPAVLAHEFQHMVHFNVRFLGLDAGQEALWLSEALAQMAEELVARAYEELGESASVDLFRNGTRARAERYLSETDSVSLIVSTGQGSLAERGAGFLHLLYLEDQQGVGLLSELSATTRTGVANVEAQTGREWPDILSDWWSALYLDGPGPESGQRVYPTVDLKGFMGAPYPLVPATVGPSSSVEAGALWSSSAAYYLVTPSPDGSMTVRLGGAAGGSSSPQAELRLRIVRVS